MRVVYKFRDIRGAAEFQKLGILERQKREFRDAIDPAKEPYVPRLASRVPYLTPCVNTLDIAARDRRARRLFRVRGFGKSKKISGIFRRRRE